MLMTFITLLIKCNYKTKFITFRYAELSSCIFIQLLASTCCYFGPVGISTAAPLELWRKSMFENMFLLWASTNNITD